VKRSPLWLLAGFFAATASLADMKTYYALELRGGSRVYAVDKPVQKGRVLVFHRYPDGVYLSLSASEVEKIATVQSEAPPAPAEKLAPGGMLYVGPALHGPAYEAPPAPPSDSSVEPYGSAYGYGYSDYYWGGGDVPSPRPPGPVPPSRIGPNGFPILAPPGSPGSVPPPIGPNGFPILAPPPVQIQPVTRRR
jgi:hypothetical protein